jgi:hypothetical protein
MPSDQGLGKERGPWRRALCYRQFSPKNYLPVLKRQLRAEQDSAFQGQRARTGIQSQPRGPVGVVTPPSTCFELRCWRPHLGSLRSCRYALDHLELMWPSIVSVPRCPAEGYNLRRKIPSCLASNCFKDKDRIWTQVLTSISRNNKN